MTAIWKQRHVKECIFPSKPLSRDPATLSFSWSACMLACVRACMRVCPHCDPVLLLHGLKGQNSGSRQLCMASTGKAASGLRTLWFGLWRPTKVTQRVFSFNMTKILSIDHTHETYIHTWNKNSSHSVNPWRHKASFIEWFSPTLNWLLICESHDSSEIFELHC